MKVEPFKMKVTPEQSKIVQERLFELGYTWKTADQKILVRDSRHYLFFDSSLTWGVGLDEFPTEILPELTFEQFKNKYIIPKPTYSITKESLLRTAEEIPESRAYLKKLFPEAFRESDYFDLYQLRANKFLNENGTDAKLLFTDKSAIKAGFADNCFIQLRIGGDYMGKAFMLDDEKYNWELKPDTEGFLCLIPTRKD